MAFDRIESNPQVLNGKPTIRGTRITVARVLGLLAAYPDRRKLLEDYKQLVNEDLDAALHFAAAMVDLDGVVVAPNAV